MYKINYLVRQELRDEGGEPITVTKEIPYSEADIEIASCHWKAMGFKRILSVECIAQKNHKGEMVKPKLSPSEIVEMFYAPVGKVNGKPYAIDVTAADLKVKTQLLAKYGNKVEVEKKKPEEEIDIDSEVAEIVGRNEPEEEKITFDSPDVEKEWRKEKLYPALKKAKIKFAFNQQTDQLVEKLTAKGIRI